MNAETMLMAAALLASWGRGSRYPANGVAQAAFNRAAGSLSDSGIKQLRQNRSYFEFALAARIASLAVVGLARPA